MIYKIVRKVALTNRLANKKCRILFHSAHQREFFFHRTNKPTAQTKTNNTKQKYLNIYKAKKISKKMAPLTEEENTGDFKDQQFGEKEVADKVVEQCES
jgi:hypothetical protein